MLLVLDLPDPKRSSENTFVSYGLFLIVFRINLVVFFLFAGAGVWGGFAADGCLSRCAFKGAFVFLGGGFAGSLLLLI